VPPKPEPVVKPEPPKEDPAEKARKALAQAGTLLKEAAPLYRQFAEATEQLPADRATLEKLLRQAEQARQKLAEARSLYAGAKDAAPDRTVVESRIAQIGELVTVLDRRIADIRARLR